MGRLHVGILAAVLLTASLAGCFGPDRPNIRQAGSSTVLPIAQAWGEEFFALHRDVDLRVESGGSGAGFKKFCRGEIQIADASRPIGDSEVADCRAQGIEPYEIRVAIDGLAVVVSRDNTWVDHLTVPELHRMWTADTSQQANTWRDLRPDWPAERIQLFGPGTDSGTFDYFVEVIIHPFDGKESKGRSDFTKSEDDNVLVQGIRATRHGLAYFGLAYAAENEATVRIVPIAEEADAQPTFPTPANVEAGDYTPLSRPLYMYTDGIPTGRLADYFQYGLSDEGQGIVQEVGYIRLPQEQREATLRDIAAAAGDGQEAPLAPEQDDASTPHGGA